jgi:hypothetical protein
MNMVLVFLTCVRFSLPQNTGDGMSSGYRRPYFYYVQPIKIPSGNAETVHKRSIEPWRIVGQNLYPKTDARWAQGNYIT